MNWFLIVLTITVALRGFGAGLIYDVAIISLPVRSAIGAVPYVTYVRSVFERRGLKTYGPVSVIGALLTVAISIAAFVQDYAAVIRWSTFAAVAATVLAFAGTFVALPAVLELRKLPLDDEDALNDRLDRFAFWHGFSTLWQCLSFVALLVALANV